MVNKYDDDELMAVLRCYITESPITPTTLTVPTASTVSMTSTTETPGNTSFLYGHHVVR